MVNCFLSRFLTLHRLPPLQGQCILCAGDGQQWLDLCQPCESELPFLGNRCRQCALPLEQLNKQLCGQCLRLPPPFSRTEAIWSYQPPIAQLIAAFKYEKRLSYGTTLSKMAVKSIANAYQQTPLPDTVCPVPLHWQRFLKRGFNQSEIIAKNFTSSLNIPLIHHLLRDKSTPHQQGLNAKQRSQNLRGAFRVAGNVKGKTIAVIDDVMTTGATASAAAQCLLAAGALDVHIWCLARTPH